MTRSGSQARKLSRPARPSLAVRTWYPADSRPRSKTRVIWASSSTTRIFLGSSATCLSDGKLELNAGAFSALALLDRDRSAVRLHDAARDRQSDPKTGLSAGAEKFLEDLGSKFRRNARALVIHCEANVVSFAVYGNGDAAVAAGVFGCVLHQGEDYLRDQARINTQRGQTRLNYPLNGTAMQEWSGTQQCVFHHFIG